MFINFNGKLADVSSTTIRIFLKGLKNALTIATKVYEKEPQTLVEAIKEVEKLQTAQQITSTLLPTSSVNTMSRNRPYGMLLPAHTML